MLSGTFFQKWEKDISFVYSSRQQSSNCSLPASEEAMMGIYTTSVNDRTLDKAPMAYKSLEDIIDVMRDSVDVIDILKPVYNFKAAD